MIVYSTIFGRTDSLKEPLNPDGAEFVMFTDNPDLTSVHWDIRVVPKLERPKRECRKLKQCPHTVFPGATTLWVDASYQLVMSPREIASRFPYDFCAFPHPRRTRITEEAPAIIKAAKAKEEAIYRQLADYQSQGWDTEENRQTILTAGGFLLRRSTPTVEHFNELWNEEVQKHTLRDQMSLDFCAHRAGLRIFHFPWQVYSNPMARHTVSRNPVNDY